MRIGELAHQSALCRLLCEAYAFMHKKVQSTTTEKRLYLAKEYKQGHKHQQFYQCDVHGYHPRRFALRNSTKQKAGIKTPVF